MSPDRSIKIELAPLQKMPAATFERYVNIIKQLTNLRGGGFGTMLKTGKYTWHGHCKESKFAILQDVCRHFLNGHYIEALRRL
jgi:hypothetical protein